jgi:hypothetical protein
MVKRQIQIRVDGGGIKDLEHADRAAETAHLEHDGVCYTSLPAYRYSALSLIDSHGQPRS